jgi:hypothetical protein
MDHAPDVQGLQGSIEYLFLSPYGARRVGKRRERKVKRIYVTKNSEMLSRSFYIFLYTSPSLRVHSLDRSREGYRLTDVFDTADPCCDTFHAHAEA